MIFNKTKAKLKAGQTVLGCFMRHGDPGLAEAMGYMGWDYLLFDGEHSPLSTRECEQLARISELTGTTSIVRVPFNVPWMIGQVLDTGIQGVQIPMINSGADAETAARAAKYAPMGTQGPHQQRARRTTVRFFRSASPTTSRDRTRRPWWWLRWRR